LTSTARANLAHRQRLGQFFTPHEVARFAVDVLRRLGARPSTVVDAAAGEGVFLEAAREAWRDAPPQCLGVDLDTSLVLPERAGIERVCGNGLLDEASCGLVPEAFDAALGNPPYGGECLLELRALSRGADSASARRLAHAILCESELWERWATRISAVPAALTPAVCRLLDKASRFPIELLFVERFVRLLKPGGWMAIVLPEGVLANARHEFVRAWLAERGVVAAVVGLPRVFARAGASARTALLFYQKAPARQRERVLLTDPGIEWRPRLSLETSPRVDVQSYLSDVKRELSHPTALVRVTWPEMRSSRWDPQFWDARYAAPLAGMAPRPLLPLGDFITHLTYGPIVTGRSPEDYRGSVPLINQGQIDESGIDLSQAVRVAEGSMFDVERSRVRPGDLLLPRSGAGSLGRNRLAVFSGDEHSGPVNVGCFVNVIRLRDLNPYYVWFFLKTRFGWGQIRRLINGVGMPNISFDEIRGLQIPQLSSDEQRMVELAWCDKVRPAHQLWLQHAGEVTRRRAVEQTAAVVRWLERGLTLAAPLDYIG
jgi:type I restriction enzyme M protein